MNQEVKSDTLGTTRFDFAKNKPSQKALKSLLPTVDYLLKNTSQRVVVYGHTDSVGPAKYNLKLSKQRAQSVKDYLVKSGMRGERVSVVPRGE